MNTIFEDSEKIDLPHFWPTPRRVFRAGPDIMRLSERDIETCLLRESYCMPAFSSSLVEQIEERRDVSDWQAHERINYLQIQLNALQNQVGTLRQENGELKDIIRELKPESFREEEVDLNIEWRHVRSVVELAASELNWDVGIDIDPVEKFIIVTVTEEQDDMIAETTFDFYSSIGKRLNKEIFRVINFHFVSDSN